VPQQNNLPINY